MFDRTDERRLTSGRLIEPEEFNEEDLNLVAIFAINWGLQAIFLSSMNTCFVCDFNVVNVQVACKIMEIGE